MINRHDQRAGNRINPDPDDHATREARGAVNAVRDPDAMPEMQTVAQLKGAAMAWGSYSAAIRPALAAKILARMAEFSFGEKLIANFKAMVAAAGNKPSDEESEEAFARKAAKTDVSDVLPRRGRTRADAMNVQMPGELTRSRRTR
jgi:hypothetical protein